MGTNELIALVVAVVLLVIGLQLLRGKWTFLIAGYNTMNQSEKEKVNLKFVSRTLGALLTLSAVNVGVLLLFPQFSVFCFIIQLLLVISTIAYVNLSKRKMK